MGKVFPFCPFPVSSAHFSIFPACSCFLLQSAQPPLFFYTALTAVFSPTCKNLFLLAELSHLPGLLAPQTHLPRSVTSPRTKRFLYKTTLALHKPGWDKGWRESQQEKDNVMELVGVQSRRWNRASTNTWGAAIMVGN